MKVFLNGQLVPEEQATVSVFDRGFLYGDGLFETLRVANGRFFRWRAHLERLGAGAEFLGLKLPYTAPQIRDFALQLVQENQMPEALLRLQLSRGPGPVGYSRKGADQPSFVMTLHPVPEVDPNVPLQWRLITASFRIPSNETLTKAKHCNRLSHIMAHAEAEARSVDEALMLNTMGEVCQAASSNLFWFYKNKAWTPPPAGGSLPGITRAVVLEICQEKGIVSQKAVVRPELLRQSQALFLTDTALGVIEVIAMDGHDVGRMPQVAEISKAYWEKVRKETS